MSNIVLFDSHTHLNAEELFFDRETHLKYFIDAGWVGIVNIGANYKWSKVAVELTRAIKSKMKIENTWTHTKTKIASHKDFYAGATIGIHPSETIKFDDKPAHVTEKNLEKKLQEIKNLFWNFPHDICAIWECGIDLHYPRATETLQLQQELLARQCQFALETWLPLVIHSRNGFQETIETLEKYFWNKKNNTIPIVFHCFGYWAKEAEYLVKTFENIYIWFDGNITYKSAQQLREAFLVTPKNKILVETDAPYLSPIPVRWEINTPKNIAHTYKFLAELQETPLEEFANQIYNNSHTFFGIK